MDTKDFELEIDMEIDRTPGTFNWTSTEEEKLLNIISENRALWDTTSREYRDAERKKRIYIKISTHFKGTTPYDIEKKFTLMKEKYRREIKKAQPTTKEWPLLSKMKFMTSLMRSTREISKDSRPQSSERSTRSKSSSLTSSSLEAISINTAEIVPAPECKSQIENQFFEFIEMEMNRSVTPETFHWTDAEEDKLINIISGNRALWDNRSREYRDSEIKKRIYMNISTHFKGTTPYDIEKKFKLMREKYRREVNKPNTTNKWRLIPKMKFLAKVMKTRKKTSKDLRPQSTERCSTSSKSYALTSSASSSSLEDISNNTAAIVSAPEHKSQNENHYKVFDFLAEECNSMDANKRNKFIKEVMDIFWKYKL